MHPANERCYNVKSSLIGWAHSQIDLCHNFIMRANMDVFCEFEVEDMPGLFVYRLDPYSQVCDNIVNCFTKSSQ